jgi:hypothetical protein
VPAAPAPKVGAIASTWSLDESEPEHAGPATSRASTAVAAHQFLRFGPIAATRRA